MANAIFAVIYTDDKGNNYVTGLNSEVFNQEVGGGNDAPRVGGRLYDSSTDAGLDALPASVKPRRVKMRHPTSGKLRYITILEATAPLWTNQSTSLSIEDSDGVAATYTKAGTIAERFGRQRVKVA